MSLELVPLGTMVVELADPLVLPNTPAGTRVIVEVKGFTVEGERLRGRNKGTAAADWLTIGPDGTGTLDVRATIETDDGALIYAYYQGRRDFSEGMDAPLRPRDPRRDCTGNRDVPLASTPIPAPLTRQYRRQSPVPRQMGKAV